MNQIQLTNKPFFSFVGLQDGLQANAIKMCNSCGLRQQATYPVPPTTTYWSPYLFVGRNPGGQEDIAGIPFVPTAPAGKLLDKYLYELGLTRQQVNITNVNHCHTINDKAPERTEIAICCRRWKTMEFEQLYPKVKYIFALGQEALAILAPGQSVRTAINNVLTIEMYNRRFFVFSLYHPGNLLRNPGNKLVVKNALRSANEFIRNNEGL